MSVWEWLISFDEKDRAILLYLQDCGWHKLKEMFDNKRLRQEVGTYETLRNRVKILKGHGYLELDKDDEGCVTCKITEKKGLSRPFRSGMDFVREFKAHQQYSEERNNA